MYQKPSKEFLLERYVKNNQSCQTISDTIGCSWATIRYYLLKYNIPLRKSSANRYVRNEDFFQTPNLENCYWAGFIAADGCITKTNSISLHIQSQDKHLLEAFKQQCGFVGPITDLQTYNKQRMKSYSSTMLRICGSNKWVTDLNNNFNITQRKSIILQPPNIIDINLQLQYIIGLIDGDGSVSLDTNQQLRFNLVGTKDIVEWSSEILHTLEDKQYIPMKVRQCKNYYIIECHCRRAYKILDKLQSIPTPYRLDRKWKKIAIYQTNNQL